MRNMDPMAMMAMLPTACMTFWKIAPWILVVIGAALGGIFL